MEEANWREFNNTRRELSFTHGACPHMGGQGAEGCLSSATDGRPLILVQDAVSTTRLCLKAMTYTIAELGLVLPSFWISRFVVLSKKNTCSIKYEGREVSRLFNPAPSPQAPPTADYKYKKCPASVSSMLACYRTVKTGLDIKEEQMF
uniref:Uncharacterized protein n=1 Tax=Timema genevievae TaxID=629358 RepID=A0A7R9PIR3_TIMGE|nr:unnamed protein product [Timema genevievae]